MKKTLLACSFLLFFGLLALAAVSEQGFSLSASPGSPYPGETVNIRVSPPLDADRHGIRWKWEGGTDNFAVRGDDSASYEAGDSSAKITAQIWDRLSGADVAAASLEVFPKSYEVSIISLTPEDTVRLWDDDARAMTDRKGRMSRNRVTLEAAVEPQPAGELRYVWTPGEGVAQSSDEGNRCVVYRETPGTLAVSLSVFDKNNIRLGKADIALVVDISFEDQERSLKLNMGWERWRSALALREKGEVENALLQARQAFEELTAGGMKDDALRVELNRFRQVHGNYFRALEQASAAASLWRDGKPEEALGQYRQARTLYAHSSIEKAIAELEAILKRSGELREKAAALAKEAQELAGDGNLDGALEKYNESLVFYPSIDVRKERAGVDGRRQAIARRKELAEIVRQVGLSLENQDNFEEALSKMAEAEEIWNLPEITADMGRIRAKIEERQRRRDESGAMTKEASQLELKGLEGQGSPDVLNQALEKYRQARDIWRDDSVERAMLRVAAHIDRINGEIEQAAFFAKEAESLAGDKRLDEALDRYHSAQALRRSDDVEKKIAELENLRETRRNFIKEAEAHYLRAEELEKRNELDEALVSAKLGEEILVSNDLVIDRFAAVVKRLEFAVEARDGKIARAAALAEQGRVEPHPEKALDLLLESVNIWPNDETAQKIHVLRGLLHESRTAEARASELYKEAVVLERESKLAEAEEKLLASINMKSTPEAEGLLDLVRQGTARKIWMETLLSQPLALRAVPLIPRVGERTTVHVEGGAWTVDTDLTYQWSLSGNALENAPLNDGRAYGFYPADDQPVTVTLTVLRTGTDLALNTRMISVTPEPRSVRVVMNEGARVARLWNSALKRLEETHEIATGTDIELRAEVIPMPEGEVFYSWNVDQESVLTVPEDPANNRASVRRTSPGTAHAEVEVKDSRGIALGKGLLSIIVAVDQNDAARDLRRSQAWAAWTEAGELWREKKRLPAVEKATEASLLDPGDPEITHGLSKMKDDLGRMENASRLLAESSLLIARGELDEAGVKISEAEALWPDEKTFNIRYELMSAGERARTDSMLAANMRAEGDALMRQGAKPEALLRFQDSLLLSENDAVRRNVAGLAAEIEAEKELLEEVQRLRNEGSALAGRRHYAEAVERFTRSMRLMPDPYLASYVEALGEMAEREKVFVAEALKLREEGDALMSDKKVPEALAKYKESLRVRHDEALAAKVREEEDRIAQARAAQLRREAEALVRGRKPAEALAKYRESLTYAHNDAAAAYVRRAEEEEAKKRSDALIKEGDALFAQRQPEKALEIYRSAAVYAPNNEALLEKIRGLELILTPAVGESGMPDEDAPPDELYGDAGAPGGSSLDLVQADALYREGNSLYRQKKYAEALEKYRESYRLSGNQTILEFADQLEETLEVINKANELVRNGNDLYKAQKYKEAIALYRESLKFHSNPDVETFILRVEALLR
ncbi:MAG: tetratricopeptide repeat protein [Synergistaceae bacterium]|nr:tetratricopeptide repeat protein [Synergistaceae bacterium]